MQPPTDEKRLTRVKRYHREDEELIRALPKLVPSTEFKARDALHKQLEDRYGLLGYTPSQLTRRLRDLGYTVANRKEQGTRRDFQAVMRHPHSFIYGPDWHTGEFCWLRPFQAAMAHDAPRPVPGLKAPLGARIHKEFNELVASEAPLPDIDNIRG